MHFSKTFHRFISFTSLLSLKSTPDGQKLFLNWLCNLSSYINTLTRSSPCGQGMPPFLYMGRALFPLLGKRPGGLENGARLYRHNVKCDENQVTDLRATGGSPCLLVPQLSHPPPAPHFFLVQHYRTLCFTDVQGAGGLGVPKRDCSSMSIKSGGQRWRWEAPDQKNKNIYFVLVIFEIFLKYRKV